VAERERRLEMFCELSKTSLLRTDGERGFLFRYLLWKIKRELIGGIDRRSFVSL